MHSLVLRLTTPRLSKSLTRIDTEIKKWDVRQFSVKSVDYVEELQHPRGMEHCTRKTSDVSLHLALKKFSATLLSPRHNEQEFEVDITKVQFSLLSSPQRDDSVQTWSPESFCRPGPVSALPSPPHSLFPPSAVAQVIICGSQDWLATWGRHWVMTGGPVGVWLSRQRPLTKCCRAVPLGFHFCRERERKREKNDVNHFCQLAL